MKLTEHLHFRFRHSHCMIRITSDDENLLQKYLDEDNRIESMILNTDDIAELIRVGVLDKDGVIKNRQFRYPESFIKYIDIFIDNELKI